ncbi:zinc finger, CCHC-type containing protein [Tanacetum coccineum]|uniref:Zinc finger, CCHC-type containing protein n=1 Tax=Tanacetum coccineum TaxID=301880 RepID=A0ABQ5GM83_9ASTR
MVEGWTSQRILIGMDWLSNYKEEIICHKKVVRIPLPVWQRWTYLDYRLFWEVIFRIELILEQCRQQSLPTVWPPSEMEELFGTTQGNPRQRFIENFSKIGKSLTILTQKCKTFDWGEEQELAFQTLKDKLCNAPALALSDGSDDFLVYCDASRDRTRLCVNAKRQLNITHVADRGYFVINDCEFATILVKSNIKDMILIAQKEVVDESAGLQKGLDEMIEQRSDGTLYYLDQICVPLKGEVLVAWNEKDIVEYVSNVLYCLKAFRFYVIEPNDSVSINSIIESRDAIFDENRFSSVPRASLRIPNRTEDIGGSVVPEEIIEEEQGMRVIGCLMYAMTCIRPDIAFALGKLSRYTSNPVTLMQAEFSNTKDNSSTSGWYSSAWCDANSRLTKKTNLHYIPNTWYKKFVALAAAGKEAECAATLAKSYSQMYNGKSRHLGVRHSMIRELIMNEVKSIEFVRSQPNLADHLTKGLARDLVIKSAEGM